MSERTRTIADVEQLEALLATPSAALIEDLKSLDGDLMLLGSGGKMGPSLAMLARNAIDAAGRSNAVIAVSRFSDKEAEQRLNDAGVMTHRADLLDEAQLASLPDVANVVYMAAMKFGATGQEARTWAMNTYLPGRVAERFKSSRISAFSTGNVYPLSPLASGGPTEDDPTGPIGEYAQSCLGRERMFEYFSQLNGTKVSILRLNYALVSSSVGTAVGSVCLSCLISSSSSTATLVHTAHCPSSPPTMRISTVRPSTATRYGVSRSSTMLSSLPV